MIKIRTMDTSSTLLFPYEILAIEHRKLAEIQLNLEADQRDKYNACGTTFGLLILNASILEGILRNILSHNLQKESDILTREGKGRGRTSPSNAHRLLLNYLHTVESQGGWEKIKDQYSFYFGISLTTIGTDELREGINTLFALRNILAHGTAIVQPKEIMQDSMKEQYPYVWQTKLQQTRTYLEKHFGKNDLYENLAEPIVPEHFLQKTVGIIAAVEAKIVDIPEHVKTTIALLKGYKFGYINLQEIQG